MALRLSGQTSILGVGFFVSESLLRIEEQKNLKKIAILTLKTRNHGRTLINQTWPIESLGIGQTHQHIWVCFALTSIIITQYRFICIVDFSLAMN